MTNVKRWSAAVCTLALAGLSLGDVKVARAADTNYAYPFASYPGSTCAPQSEGVTTWLRSGWGYNSSVSPMYVSCPIVRRNPDSIKGTGFTALYFTNPSLATTTCTLYHHDVAGTVMKSSTKSMTVKGFSALYFDALTPVSSWGSYSIICNVPSHGFINAYYINERYL
jgi:hypothetical protein